MDVARNADRQHRRRQANLRDTLAGQGDLAEVVGAGLSSVVVLCSHRHLGCDLECATRNLRLAAPACRSPASTSVPLLTLPAPAKAARTAPPP
jgi:hypothetical protein